jgi:pimeloyl-ACP methyl ester carboxylesterase
MAGIGPEELDERGIGQLRWIERFVGVNKQSRQTNPCFILVLQIKKQKGCWFDRHGDPPPADAKDLGDEQITVLHELIKKVVPENAIDPERIYLIGISAGGVACFEMAMRYPRLFAAMAPISASGGGDLSRAHHLVDMPVWAFHNSGDGPEQIRATIAAINSAGGSAYLTEFPLSHHDSWTPATSQYDIFAWLFSQRRGHWSYPPGFAPLPWWNWLALGGMACLVYLVWRSQANKAAIRKRKTEALAPTTLN